MKLPPNFISLMLSLAGVILSALALLASTNKSNTDETRRLEQRLCRLEALSATGECKR